MKIIKANPGDFIAAGQQGEELARRVEFDISEWERLYGPGTVQLLVKRMTDETFYPTAIEQEQGVAVWNVTVPETSVAGKYHTYELRYYARETLAKAVGGLFSINEAFVGDEGDVPEVHKGWVEQVIATGAGSLAAQKAAEAARDEAIEAQLNANLANTEAQTAKQEAANYAESVLKAENNTKEYAKNAKSSEDAAVKAAEVAENSERNAIEAARQAELSKDGIVQAENNASQYAAAAAKSATDASASASSAQTFMAGAETARSQAQTSAQAASNFSGRAEESAETAKTNAKAAKAAADSVLGYAEIAESSATSAYNNRVLAEIAKDSIVNSEEITSENAEKAAKFASEAKTYKNEAVRAANDASASEGNAKIFMNSAYNASNTAAVHATNASMSAKKAEEAALKAGGVKSVNGILPDANGNVEIEAGGGGVSSWNDLTDKPFGETKEVVEILPECQPEFNPDIGALLRESALPISVGGTYIVTHNGTEYSCVAQDVSEIFGAGTVGLGDMSEIGLGGHGEPFAIISGVDGMTAELMWDGSTTLTISIRGEQTTITPLPAKYLPEGVPYIEDGGMVELTVSGEWVLDGDMYMFGFSAAIGLEVGKIYIVNWNGTEYEVVGQDAAVISGGNMPGVFLGNPITMGGTDTGDPFMLVEYPADVVAEAGVYGMAASTDFSGGIPFSIYQGSVTIHKLDNRCLDLEWLPTYDSAQIYGNTALELSNINKVNDRYVGQFIDTANVIPLVAGQTYSVSLNGVVYECVAEQDSSGMVVLGDTNLTNSSVTFSGIPFSVGAGYYSAMETSLSLIAVKVTEEEKTAGVAYRNLVITTEQTNKLPAEFLPDTVATKADIFGAMEASY